MMDGFRDWDTNGVHHLPPSSRSPEFRPGLRWLGDRPPEPPPWLVRDLLPQKQIAIGAGVFSAGKTFAFCDLAACVLLGEPFAGRTIDRPGGILWLAAEGASEIDARITAALLKIDASLNLPTVPFACQALDVPRLKDANALQHLLQLAMMFKHGVKTRTGMNWDGYADLSMIVIDTIGSAADFEDGNNSAEAQKVFNTLRALSDRTDALVFVVDHFGKAVETGVMGASAKAQSADAVLAILCDKSIEGDITNRRMAVHKLRGGPSGSVTPFALRPVSIGSFGGTTCVVDWQSTATEAPQPKAKARSTWTGNGKLLKSSLERMLLDHGEAKRPFGFDGPEVKAVRVDRVRTEFKAIYAGENEQTKARTFRREVEKAVEHGLVTTREIGTDAADWIWLNTP